LVEQAYLSSSKSDVTLLLSHQIVLGEINKKGGRISGRFSVEKTSKITQLFPKKSYTEFCFKPLSMQPCKTYLNTHENQF